MNIYKEITNEKAKLTILFSDHDESPREFDNLGTMICFHRRYDLGDSHNYNSGDYGSWSEVKKAIERDYRRNKDEVAVILPLFLYDHSGITISTKAFSCPWDSGQVGFIVVGKEKLRKEYNVKKITEKIKEKAKEVLLGEVDVYDSYITGEVYGFKLEDLDGELIDGCYGFYGQDGLKTIVEYLPEEYKELAKSL